MKHMVHSIVVASAPGSGNGRHRADDQPKHGYNQDEHDLRREPQRFECSLGIRKASAHRRIDGQAKHTQDIQTDYRQARDSKSRRAIVRWVPKGAHCSAFRGTVPDYPVKLVAA